MTPNTRDRVKEAQARQKAAHDKQTKERQFHPGETVFVRNFSAGPK